MNEKQSKAKQWFYQYWARTEQGVFKPRIEGICYECPCCGYPTLRSRGGNQICILCHWEDDGQDDPHADEVWGGPNYYLSLSTARENFRKYLITMDPQDIRFEVHNSEIIKEIKHTMMTAYDALDHETNEEKREVLQEEIDEARKILREEVSARYREFREKNGLLNK